MERIRQPKLYMGLIVYVAAILMLVFAAVPLQSIYGIYGLMLTELILLACAVVPALLLRYDLRAVFAAKMPTLRQVFGVCFLWSGVLLAVYFLTYLIMYLFPEGMGEVAWSLTDFFTGAPLPVALIAVALMPAVCEEALFRGFIQRSFGGIRRKWLVVLLTGLLFGVFHLDPYRFLPTMALGLALSYLMAETGNLLLPVLFHFINNAWSTLLSFLTKPLAESAQAGPPAGIPFATVGAMLVLCAASPWLVRLGARLLKPREQTQDPGVSRRRRVWIPVGVSALCAVIGIGIVAVSAGELIPTGEKVLDMSFTADVSRDAAPVSYPVTIEKAGRYDLEFSVGAAGDKEGYTRILLTDKEGRAALDVSGGGLFGNSPAELAAGGYTLTFEYHYEFEETEKAEIRFIITRLN